MKNLFILASTMVILFLAIPNKVEAQKKKSVIPVEGTVNVYLRQRVTSESGGALSLSSFRKTNGWEQSYGVYVIEWQAEILFQQECWKPGDMFAGYWQNFGVMLRRPNNMESILVGVGSAQHYAKGTIVRLKGTATLRKTEQGWRLEGFDVKTYQVLAVQPTQVSKNLITFSDGTRYEGGLLGGKPNSRGVLTFADGRRQEGNWSKGKFLSSSTIAGQKTITLPYKPIVSGTTAKTGTYAIKPQFDSAHDFSEGLALVRIGDFETGKYGYIDKTGKMVFAMYSVFNDTGANSFSNGLAAVVIGNKKSYKSGYINKTSKIDIFPQFSWSNKFSEGLAAVRVSEANFKWGFIDKSGNLIISAQFDVTQEFSEGLAAVMIGDYKTGRWGYIDKTGKMVVTPQFVNEEISEGPLKGGSRIGAQKFSEGLASVRIGDGNTARFGYIDKTGKVVIAPQFNSAGMFSGGLAMVRIGDDKPGKVGYIDKSGTMVITPQFVSSGGFSEGLAWVKIGDDEIGRIGYIDKYGKVVITPQFDLVWNFSEGLAAVRIGDEKTGKWGYINKTGQMVITPQFDMALDFSEGLAKVRIGDNKTGKWGYIYR